eukprot:2254055-Rhodomonas_salina.3
MVPVLGRQRVLKQICRASFPVDLRSKISSNQRGQLGFSARYETLGNGKREGRDARDARKRGRGTSVCVRERASGSRHTGSVQYLVINQGS